MWSAANSYLEQKSPWLEIREYPEAAALTLRTAMNLVFLFGLVSEPIIPSTAATLRSLFELAEGDAARAARWPEADDVRNMSWVPAGCGFTVPAVLFRKLTDDDIAAWRERFGAEPVS